ncbi:MAG: glycosyltransferase [Calothrix sp. MO_167.B42]|nr:glycosyltransferase [Calothrix sp. MO_167.B42]
MHIGFLNPQGNFDSKDSHWTEHPDFGGQLVYVKQLAMAMAAQGHKIDILTRQIIDPEWPAFADKFDAYPHQPNIRIIRLPAGPENFLRKELLWPHIIKDWVPNILEFYREEGQFPDAMTAHFGDGGLSAVLIQAQAGIPFTFTAHSLGALKMDRLHVTPENIAEMNNYYYFGYRLFAERLSMNHSGMNITSTRQQERFQQYAHPAYQGSVDVNDDNRFATIPPGVNPDVFGAEVRLENEEVIYQKIQDRLVRDIFKQRRTLPAIIASSRLEPKKNNLGLVKAFASSPTLQEQANLVIFTKGEDDPLRTKASDEISEKQVLAPIRKIVDDQNLWGKISAFSIPNQSALAAAYRFFVQYRSVFSLVSLHEPFGLAPLEAAVAGLPVVATQDGGPKESLQKGDEKFCILVDPTSTTEIAQGLETAISQPEVWDDLQKRGCDHVLRCYTWKRTAQEYLQMLEKIVAAPKPSPDDLLPIHPYFLDPTSDNDVSLSELSELYLTPEV